MIFVEDEVGIKGPVNSWASFKPEGNIKRLILTDNFSFFKELSGFNSYFVDREALSILRHSGGVANKLVKESIYGIKDTEEAEKDLLLKYNQALKNRIDEGTTKEALEQVKNVYEKLLKRIKKEQVVRYSLIVDEEKLSLSKSDVVKHALKKGDSNNVYKATDILPKRYWNRFKNVY